MAGVYQADYLTSADQVIPDWFKILLLGEVGTIIKLGMKSQFGDVGLSTSGLILGLLSLFFSSKNVS